VNEYLVDTVVWIWAVRGLHEAPAILASLRRLGRLAVSAITLLELRRALAPEEYEAAERLLAGVQVLPVDGTIARAAGTYLVRCADEGYRVDFFAGIVQTTAALTGRLLVTYSEAQYPLAGCRILPLAGVPRAAAG
jgi:predicted nucleic acid-binding protein